MNSIQMFGGGEIWMLRTLDGLARRGHDVFLLCRPGTELARRAEKMGIQVFTIRIRGDFDPFTIWQTARLLRRLKIQIVLTNMDKELRFAGIGAKLVGGIVVIPRRGIDYPLKNKIQYRFSYNRLADHLLANSRATRQALLQNAPWLDPDRITVIYNGIDPAPFFGPALRDIRSELGIPADDAVFGFVGQLDERKGIFCLLNAFKMAASQYPARLLLAGEGPMEAEILCFIKENGLADRVFLLGFMNDVSELYKNMDVFILPSLWEGFGIVLIEAMAAGKPVVTTAVSSMPEIVQHEKTGLVVPVNNAHDLADALLKLMKDRHLARRMGEKGRNRVLQLFTMEKMLDSLEQLFEKLLERKHEHMVSD
ncbi:glycosyltransferase family 4 protein [candidate division KSB1 bacterium]|nr:glycosyltransferase family 4 protein [candidate division KSB1 bacterium]